MGAGTGALRRRGGLRVEQGPSCGSLGLGPFFRHQPFNSVHVHQAPTVCQVLGTVQGQRQSPQTLTEPSWCGGFAQGGGWGVPEGMLYGDPVPPLPAPWQYFQGRLAGANSTNGTLGTNHNSPVDAFNFNNWVTLLSQLPLLLFTLLNSFLYQW